MKVSLYDFTMFHFKARAGREEYLQILDREEKWAQKLVDIYNILPGIFDRYTVKVSSYEAPGTLEYEKFLREMFEEVYSEDFLVPAHHEEVVQFLRDRPEFIWYQNGEEEDGESSWLICHLIGENFDVQIYYEIAEIIEEYARAQEWSAEKKINIMRTIFEATLEGENGTPIEMWARKRRTTDESNENQVPQVLIDLAPDGAQILADMREGHHLPTLISHFRTYRINLNGRWENVLYSRYQKLSPAKTVSLATKLNLIADLQWEMGFRLEEIFTPKVIDNIAQDFDEFMDPSMAWWIAMYPPLLRGIEQIPENAVKLRTLEPYFRDIEQSVTAEAYQNLSNPNNVVDPLVPAMLGVMTENTELQNRRARK